MISHWTSPLQQIRDWSPFKLDALSLVTLFGANGLQRAIGRLVFNPYIEPLPLIAGQLMPDDLIAQSISGFVLYNVTDGIMSTAVSAWFARWLLCQNLEGNSSSFNISVESRSRSTFASVFATLPGLLFHAGVLVLAALFEDWYGFASALGLTLMTLSRNVILRLFRNSLDAMTQVAQDSSTADVKALVTLPTAQAATIYVTRGVVVHCLLKEARPHSHRLHLILRTIGWFAFGIHVITLGMACLCVQLILVLPMMITAWLVVQQIGCDEIYVGTRLKIEEKRSEGAQNRARMYASLNLSDVERDNMVNWSLFPALSNDVWWNLYRTCQEEFAKDPTAFDTWGTRVAKAYPTNPAMRA